MMENELLPPEYKRRLDTLLPEQRNQWLEGSWDIPEVTQEERDTLLQGGVKGGSMVDTCAEVERG